MLAGPGPGGGRRRVVPERASEDTRLSGVLEAICTCTLYEKGKTRRPMPVWTPPPLSGCHHRPQWWWAWSLACECLQRAAWLPARPAAPSPQCSWQEWVQHMAGFLHQFSDTILVTVGLEGFYGPCTEGSAL